MRKIILCFIAAVVFQMIEAQDTTYGLKGGFNYAGFHGSNQVTQLSDFKNKFGFNIGFFTKISVRDKFFIQPELLFSTQGSKIGPGDIRITDFEGREYILRNRSKYDLFYLNLPVMGKYYVNEDFSVEFGPQFGYQVKGKLKSKILNREDLPEDVFGIVEDGEFDIEGVKKFDIGINIGVGYDIAEQIGLGLRYNYGITKIFDRGSPFKNSVLQLSLEYRFKS